MRQVRYASVFLMLSVLCLAPRLAHAASPFDGTWKVDAAATQFPDKPTVLLVKDGMYACVSCEDHAKIAADGKPHAVTTSPYHDARLVKIIDRLTVESWLLKGSRKVAHSTYTVSADGATMKQVFSDSQATNGAPVTGTGTFSRVGAQDPAAHAVSGNWKATSQTASNNAMIVTIATRGEMVSVSSPIGIGYRAALDGTEAPYRGDPGKTAVSIRLAAPRTLVETDKRGSRVVEIDTMTVSADGKSIRTDVDDKTTATHYALTFTKQQ